MNAPWLFHSVEADLKIRTIREMDILSLALSKEVDAVWISEQHRLNGALFNGRVFSADIITPHLISGHWTEFRRIVAQMRRPELHSALAIRPLAVGGIITGPDGVIFGRRPHTCVYQAGEWQLPPAGSVDFSAARPQGVVDFVTMLLTELTEEIGLTADDVSIIGPVGIVEHANTHVLDLGIAMQTHLRRDQIHGRHQAHGNGEYDPLIVVERSEIQNFLSQPDITLQASIFLKTMEY